MIEKMKYKNQIILAVAIVLFIIFISTTSMIQANSPEYVRYSVEFFKENNLSIFSEPNS